MNRSNKKRIARVGQSNSNEDNLTSDVVTDIIKQMEAGISDPDILKILNYPIGGTNKSNLGVSSAISTQPNIAPLQHKKFLTAKRHPLMEKAQKSKNYIKHNRSLPKPRAHLSGKNESLSSAHLKKSSTVSATSCHRETSSQVETHSYKKNVKAQSRKLPVLTSDSESEFESFIRAQKHDTESNESTEKRRKNKHQKSGKKRKILKQKKYTKDKQIKCVELERKDNNSRHGSEIFSKVSTTNRIQLPETSDSFVSSSDEKELDFQVKIGKTSTLSSEKETDNEMQPYEQIDTNDFECTVRLDRDPYLEKFATLLNTPLMAGDNESNKCSSNPQGNVVLTECKDETALVSDDDCMIICEVPKSNNHSDDTLVIKGDNPEPDIQILNVVSLEESEKISTNDSHSGVAANFIEDNMQSNSLSDLNEKTSSMPTDIIETVNKIDLKQILSLANYANCNKNLSDVKITNSKPCSSSSTDGPPSFSILPSIKPEIMAEDHWLNIKKAVSKNKYFQNELFTNSKHVIDQSMNLSVNKPENVTNCVDNIKLPLEEPSAIISDFNLSSSALKEIISRAKQVISSNLESNIKKDCYENDCDELDVLGANNIQELFRSQSSQNIMRLLQVYNQKLQEYNEIKNSEKSLTYSLKILQETSAAKKDIMDTVLEHLMKHDPCFYLNAQSNHSIKANLNAENNDGLSERIKLCAKCKSTATIVCKKCQKVYFCSTKCGISYWEEGHYESCEEPVQ